MSQAAELHQQMFDAVLERDFAKLRSLYHDDYVYTSGDGEEQAGADAGVAVAQMYTAAFPDLTMEVRTRMAMGDRSVIEFTARGTHTAHLQDIAPTGRKVQVVGCNVVEVRDGKIWREREYYDSMSMMQQLGVMPEHAVA